MQRLHHRKNQKFTVTVKYEKAGNKGKKKTGTLFHVSVEMAWIEKHDLKSCFSYLLQLTF